MRQESGLRRLVLALAAVGGVVAAHAISYLAVFADGAERAHYLQDTGHSYWAGAVALGATGASAAVGLAVWCGARRAMGRVRDGDIAPIIRFHALALAQLGLFAGIEVAERIFAGADLSGLVHRPLFVVGLLLQVVVAALAVLVLRLVGACAERLVACRHRRAPRSPAAARPSVDVALPASLRRGAGGCRGPPVPMSA